MKNKPKSSEGKGVKPIFEILNEKIDRLEKENKKLFEYKVAFDSIVKKCEELERQLEIKRAVVRVVVTQSDIHYILQLTRVIDTPDGLFIEGKL